PRLAPRRRHAHHAGAVSNRASHQPRRQVRLIVRMGPDAEDRPELVGHSMLPPSRRADWYRQARILASPAGNEERPLSGSFSFTDPAHREGGARVPLAPGIDEPLPPVVREDDLGVLPAPIRQVVDGELGMAAGMGAHSALVLRPGGGRQVPGSGSLGHGSAPSPDHSTPGPVGFGRSQGRTGPGGSGGCDPVTEGSEGPPSARRGPAGAGPRAPRRSRTWPAAWPSAGAGTRSGRRSSHTCRCARGPRRAGTHRAPRRDRARSASGPGGNQSDTRPLSRTLSHNAFSSALLPRCSRDITVPIGIPRISAISLYENPSTS